MIVVVRGKFPLKIFNRNTLTKLDRNYMRIMNNICFMLAMSNFRCRCQHSATGKNCY